MDPAAISWLVHPAHESALLEPVNQAGHDGWCNHEPARNFPECRRLMADDIQRTELAQAQIGSEIFPLNTCLCPTIDSGKEAQSELGRAVGIMLFSRLRHNA